MGSVALVEKSKRTQAILLQRVVMQELLGYDEDGGCLTNHLRTLYFNDEMIGQFQLVNILARFSRRGWITINLAGPIPVVKLTMLGKSKIHLLGL